MGDRAKEIMQNMVQRDKQIGNVKLVKWYEGKSVKVQAISPEREKGENEGEVAFEKTTVKVLFFF